MKKIYIVILLLSIFGINNSFAQNWNLLNSNKTYFFKHSDSLYITNTIKIDSALFSVSDTTFHIHTRLKICDTCTVIPPDALNGILYHAYASEIFGHSVSYFDASVDYLVDGNLIKSLAQISDSWVFNSGLGITATVVGIDDSILFSTLDSIKIIQLSTLDTIIISKNHGILCYPDFENSGKYFLQTGYHEGQNSFGEYLPNARTIYNFAPGDEFCYTTSFEDAGFFLESINSSIQFKIMQNNSSLDTIKYIIKYYHVDQHSYFGPDPESWWPSFTTAGISFVNFSISNNKFIIENCYGTYDHSTIGINSQFYEPIWTQSSPNAYCSDVLGEEIGYIDYTYSNYFGYLKRVRTMSKYDDSLCYFSTNFSNQNRIYANGLGSISYHYYCFENGNSHLMTAFVKSNDTTGVLCYFPEDLGIENSETNQFNIYPNPTKDLLNIPANLNSISFYSLSGELILQIQNPNQSINISHLPVGLYLLQAQDENGQTFYTKLIVD